MAQNEPQEGEICIFVKYGQGKSGTFYVKPEIQVSDFMRKIVDREGCQGVRLIAGNKSLLEKGHNGKILKLNDYNVYNEMTMHAALRLKGGAAPNQQQFSTNEVTKLGGKITRDACPWWKCADHIDDESVNKATLKCGCIFCSPCMKHWLTLCITKGLTYDIHCGLTNHGGQKLEPALAYAIAAYSNDEKKTADIQLSENMMRNPESPIRQCPNAKCKQYVFKDSQYLRQLCTHCNKYMCWSCGKQHKGQNKTHCGNDNCNPKAFPQICLAQTQYKTISGIEEVPDTRLCPNMNCCAVNIYNSNCKHMQCKHCGTKYCQSCLITNVSCSLSTKCNPKGVQTITDEMIWAKISV